MNSHELKIYQRAYQLGMLNERRKWQQSAFRVRQRTGKSETLKMVMDEGSSLSQKAWQFIRSGFSI